MESRPTSLRVRLGLVALVFSTLVMIAVGMSAMMLRSWDRTLDRRVDVRQVVTDVADLRLAFTDQETGLRGYQLSEDPAYLEPYLDGDAVARSLLDRLGRNVDVVDGASEQLGDVVTAADAWHELVAAPTVDDIDAAPPDDVARRSFDELRAELDELDGIVNAELAGLDDDANRLRRNVFGVLVASALTAVAGTVLAAVLFRRWVIRPLHQVGVAARALALDDTHPLPRFDSPELQDVTDAVASLQQSLTAARDDALAALTGLEQSAVLALQVRTQLADEIGRMPAGWTADSMLVPAEGVVAGDCFDIGLLDANHLYLIVIDVTGHGAAVALDALKAKAQLRAAIRSHLDPGAAIDWVSRERLQDDGATLLTATVLTIQLDTGTIHYANAGHPTAKLTDGQQIVELQPTGPLVGAFDAAWSTVEATLRPGWTILVHTDGVTDTIGTDRERFGPDRLRGCLGAVDPAAMLHRILDAIDAFRVGSRSDDCTAIAIHRVRDARDAVADGAEPERGTVQP